MGCLVFRVIGGHGLGLGEGFLVGILGSYGFGDGEGLC